MSFNRSGYIGRAPGDSSIVLAKQYFQPTGAGKTFTFTAGYDPGLIDVYRNGVKLVNVLDYAATDGSTIVLDTPVGVGSTVQVVAYKGFNLTEVNSSGADFNVGTNLYVQSGFGSFAQGITANQIDVSGIGTIGIGSFVDVNISGAATVAGTLVANSFSGDGSALTGLANTDFIVSVATTTGNLNVSAAATITGDLTVSDSIAITKDINVGAAATITGALTGSTGTFSGAVNVDATTDSTSTSTGALIVDGGLGVAKNVYIGAGLSVAGTLTYEDVTSVDSVGLITAKSGVNITGGQLTVGSGITMGIAGVATFSGTADIHLRDSVRLNVGDSSDLTIYHDGSHSVIQHANVGNLYLNANNGQINLEGNGETLAQFIPNGGAKLYYDNSQKIVTTKDGTVTTGIGTFTTQININSNGTSIAENNLNFVCSGIAYIDHRTVGKNITFRTSSSSAIDTNAIIVGATGITTFADTPHDDLGSLRDIPLRSVTGSAATLVVGDAGKVVSTNTTGWTVPASTFSEGDTVSLLNNSAGDLTITCSAVTTYLTSDGSTVTSSTLGARGMATLYFVSASVAYLQGTALS